MTITISLWGAGPPDAPGSFGDYLRVDELPSDSPS